MHLSELLLAYKHLPILDTMLLTDDEKLYEFILIKKEDEGYVVEPKKIYVMLLEPFPPI